MLGTGSLMKPGGWAKSPAFQAASQQIMGWTRELFAIPAEAPVLVSQVDCTLPDCVPLETVVAFWTEAGERHHFKIHKPVEAVGFQDFPKVWTEDGRFVMAEGECVCC